ncbi:MarR family winged helix-turn-helix transcriptional regulator [Nocardioides currus]|uniref:MarR family transcriptional regulator n=1 Tax=Nocardioides currus TaxID=2133958 RepID=A0A2R7YTJ1_9ACTN|nr:MarR family transcriptional regulator [Nocardioides currus]PUA79702.1 MarR family transcriptional regulator [Nocardioides currus]
MTSPPSDSTGDLLMAVARRIRRETAHELEGWGITPSQSRALRVIASHEPLRLSVLAGWLRITPRSTTEVADALEEQGWIERVADPSDRRASLVSLTAEGSLLLRRIEDVRGQAAERVLDVLGERDRRTLDRILTTLGEQ